MYMGSLHFREEYLFSNLAEGACTVCSNLFTPVGSAAAIPVSSALFMVLGVSHSHAS